MRRCDFGRPKNLLGLLGQLMLELREPKRYGKLNSWPKGRYAAPKATPAKGSYAHLPQRRLSGVRSRSCGRCWKEIDFRIRPYGKSAPRCETRALICARCRLGIPFLRRLFQYP